MAIMAILQSSRVTEVSFASDASKSSCSFGVRILSELMICLFSKIFLAFSTVMRGSGLLCDSLADVSILVRAGDRTGVPLGSRLLAVLRVVAAADGAPPREDIPELYYSARQRSQISRKHKVVKLKIEEKQKKVCRPEFEKEAGGGRPS